MISDLLKFYTYYGSIIGTTITGVALLLFYRKLKKGDKTIANIFFLFFISDAIAAILALKGIWNGWWYNSTTILWMGSYLIYFYKEASNKKHKLEIIVLSTLNIVFYIVDVLLFESFFSMAFYYYVALSATLTYLVFRYLQELIEDISIQPLNEFRFWYFIGALIDFACCIPYVATLVLSKQYSNNENFELILALSINAWHLMIIIGLIWTQYKDSNKYSY